MSNPKKLVGYVIGVAMQKTAKVRVDRYVKHPKYKKYIKRSKNYLVHDPKEEAELGDKVEIVETRPISKNKHFKLSKILEKAPSVEAKVEDEKELLEENV